MNRFTHTVRLRGFAPLAVGSLVLTLKRRRKQFAGRVPENVFDYIEEVAREALLPGTEASPDSAPR
jgi:hypothetical protein